MAGELASFDALPPGLVDQVVAWCFIKYPRSGRDAAIAALGQKHGIGPEAAAPMIGAAIARSHSLTWEQIQALAWESEGWPVPVPLSAAPGLPPFPAGIYPPWLANEVTALAEFTQTPPDLAGTIVLSVLSAALGGRARVEVRPGWREPCNLYTVVALPSGSRKSTVHSALIAPVLGAEAGLAVESRERITQARTDRAVAEKTATAAAKAAADKAAEASRIAGDTERTAEDKQKAEAAAKKAAEDAGAAALLADAIDVPVAPRLVADDVTPEKAAVLMAEQGGRLAILSSEGGPFVSLAGRYSKEPNLELFLKGWSGDMLRVDRLGRPPDHVEHPALTLGLTIQPEVLKQIFGMPGFHGRGLLARVLYSMPGNTVGHRRTRTAEVPPEVSGGYAAGIENLVRSYAGWTDPAVLRMTPGATERVIQAAERLEPRLRPDGGDLGHLSDWAGKLIGTVARIAALLHAASYADAYRFLVTEETMAKAIEAGEYFTAHALAVFDFMGADPVTGDARAVLGWIRRNGKPRFTQRDLHRGMQSRFRKAEDTGPALELLAGNGWIKAVQEPRQEGRGRPKSTEFDAYPGLLSVRPDPL